MPDVRQQDLKDKSVSAGRTDVKKGEDEPDAGEMHLRLGADEPAAMGLTLVDLIPGGTRSSSKRSGVGSIAKRSAKA